MRSWFTLRLVIPFFVIVAGISTFVLLQPGTLATRTIDHDGSSFAFRIWQRHDQVFAKCTVSPDGGSTVMGLGSTSEMDTSDSEILLDETVDVVTLRVDDQVLKYDLAARTFAPSD